MHQRAKKLMGKRTAAEAFLSRILYNEHSNFPHWKQQAVFGPYILDFYSRRCHVAVELDGGYHNNRFALDIERDVYLAKKGIAVLRFTNEDLFQNTDKAVGIILKTCRIMLCGATGRVAVAAQENARGGSIADAPASLFGDGYSLSKRQETKPEMVRLNGAIQAESSVVGADRPVGRMGSKDPKSQNHSRKTGNEPPPGVESKDSVNNPTASRLIGHPSGATPGKLLHSLSVSDQDAPAQPSQSTLITKPVACEYSVSIA